MRDETDEMAGELQAQGLRHGQIHPQMIEHYHGHRHGQVETQARLNQPNGDASGDDQPQETAGHRHQGQTVLVVRSHSGVAGDMLLAGLAVLFLERDGLDPGGPESGDWLRQLCSGIMADLDGVASLHRATVGGIRGWRLTVVLPHVHEHRCLDDISGIISRAAMQPEARDLARSCFRLLAECEAEAHGIDCNEIHFHEVGSLDSILDICASCELYVRLGMPPVHCGSLPIADGQVHCAHGVLPAPAPAALRLLRDVPIHPFPGDAHAGELLTPTGLALLRTFNARFGRWPACRIRNTATVYGQKEFADAPNGLIFALGRMAE